MRLLRTMRKQIAVYWAFVSDESGGIDTDDYGNPVLTSPAEIDCRWEKKMVEYMDDQGNKTISDAVVYVDRDMRPGEVLMLGELVDVENEDNALDNDGAWEIKKTEKIPTIKANDFLRVCYL